MGQCQWCCITSASDPDTRPQPSTQLREYILDKLGVRPRSEQQRELIPLSPDNPDIPLLPTQSHERARDEPGTQPHQVQWWELIPLSLDPSKLPQLPTEVWEHVLDELDIQPKSTHPDRMKTFRACSLTCRAWLPRARYHLFKAVRVRSRDEVSQVSNVLRSNPALRTRVKKLTVLGEKDGKKLKDSSWVARVGFHLGPKLKGLEKIHISLVEFPPLGSPFYKFWSQFNRAWKPGVTRRIKTTKCRVDHLHQLTRLAFVTKAEEVRAWKLRRSYESRQRPGPVPILPSRIILPLRELLVQVELYSDGLLHSMQWHTLAMQCPSLSKVEVDRKWGTKRSKDTSFETRPERLFLISIFTMFHRMQQRNNTSDVTTTNIPAHSSLQLTTRLWDQPDSVSPPVQPPRLRRGLLLHQRWKNNHVEHAAWVFTCLEDAIVPFAEANDMNTGFHTVDITFEYPAEISSRTSPPLDVVLSRLHLTAPDAHVAVQDPTRDGCALPWAREYFPRFTQLAPNAFCNPEAGWLCDSHPQQTGVE